ncbi:MAG TPA: urease accessory protein UreD [Candidatus Polarisedimenticolaceae bacterium]|nr:urease accessory protein UreD [Candidatus Polarisedimenticolaceae bacterium]
MIAGAPVDAARVGRDGALRLSFERRGAVTALTGCRSTLPLQVLAPVALDDPAAVVSILNPTGGLLGGDRLSIEVDVAARAHAVLTTPSATRVYRADGAPTVQTVRLRLGPGAVVEWVPDHTIPFAGSALRQAFDVELDETAALVLVDAFSAGRIALGEAWRFALLESAISIRDPGGWLLHDRFVLRGRTGVERAAGGRGAGAPPAEARLQAVRAAGGRGAGAPPAEARLQEDEPAFGGLGFAEAHPYFASIAVIGAFDAARFAAEIQQRVGADTPGASLGAAVLPRRGALVRCLARNAPALVEAVERCWNLARATLLARPPLALRKG